MFTGIVEGVGTVASLSPLRAGTAITVATSLPMDTIAEGDSVAVAGVCLTVARKGSGTFTADVSKETLSKTTLGGMRPGSKVNLERALTLSGRLGGHIVYGNLAAREIKRAFEQNDFSFRGYKARVLISPLGQTLLARWLITYIIYPINGKWFQVLLWRIMKPVVIAVGWVFVLNWGRRMPKP